jgi:hypothetical protein
MFHISQPWPLRTPGSQNYLRSSFRVAGLCMMSFTMVGAVMIAVWVYDNRNHRVLLASQPTFLYIIVAGAIIQSATVVTLSFDEGAGWSEDRLTRLCNFFPWLFTVGYVIIIGALYIFAVCMRL